MEASLFILTLIVLLILLWVIDRICKAFELCSLYKAFGQMASRTANLKFSDIVKEMEEAVKKSK